MDKKGLAAIKQITDKAEGLVGDVYSMERIKSGKHAVIIKYNQNKEDLS